MGQDLVTIKRIKKIVGFSAIIVFSLVLLILFRPEVGEAIMKIVGAIYIITLLLIFIYRPKKFDIVMDKMFIPDDFIKLSAEQRKKALDLAWNLGKEFVSSFPVKTVVKNVNTMSIGFSSTILFLFTLVFLSSAIEMWQNDKEEYIALFFTSYIFYYLGCLILFKFYGSKFEAQRAMAEDAENKRIIHLLRELGRNFVLSNLAKWISDMDVQTRPLAIQESSSKPSTTFFLTSQDFSLSPSNMPNKFLGVTYLFSNGYLATVSKILFDLHTTSYSFVNSNLATYSVNQTKDWCIEEFYYEDVVEINYVPQTDTTTIVKTVDSDFIIDGFLLFGLVNGSKKQYPTSKHDAINFLTLARGKVRNSKRN